jgi:hypothetical protein
MLITRTTGDYYHPRYEGTLLSTPDENLTHLAGENLTPGQGRRALVRLDLLSLPCPRVRAVGLGL